MFVSVVVPAYNEEKYIGECLDALRVQEHLDFDYEVIVIDDGSTDRTGALAAARGAHVIRQPNRGVAAARQAGFEVARGEIIATTDADSRAVAGWLSRAVADLCSDPAAVAVYGPLRLYDGTPLSDWCTRYLVGTHMRLNALLRQPALSGNNFVVRRGAWLCAGGFDTGLASGEDLDLTLKLKALGTIVFDWHLVMPISARRTREGYLKVICHSIWNYVRVMWLGISPLPFTNVR